MIRGMKNTVVLSILSVAVILLLTLYAFSHQDAPVSDPAPIAPQAISERPVVSWEFVSEGEAEFGAPITRVFVVSEGNRNDLGTAQGSCSELSSTELQENQVSGALCWWAGAGEEFGVFEEQGGFVVKKGTQEEPTAESEGFRGNFESLFML